MLVVPLSRPRARLSGLLPQGSRAHGELGGRPFKTRHRRPARRAAHAAQELRAVEGDGERAVAALAAGRMPHRRSAARQPARSDPAAFKLHRNRATPRAGAAGTADRRTQPPRPQHPQPDPRRHHPEQGFRRHRRRASPRSSAAAFMRSRAPTTKSLPTTGDRPRSATWSPPRPAPISAARPTASSSTGRTSFWSRRLHNCRAGDP